MLARLPRALLDQPRIRATIDRALGWTLAMQSSNGGWAAFDKDNDRLIITKIPFCDFGEALDPPSADVTAHVLEALGLARLRPPPSGRRARLSIHSLGAGDRRQLVRPLGRQSHLRHGRGAAGARGDRRGHDAAVRARGRRLARRAPERRRRLGRDLRVVHGRQPARPRAEHGVADRLGAAGAGCDEQSTTTSAAIRRGIGFLIDTQRDDGTWDEPYYTGTGFPGYGFGARMDFRDQKTRERIAQGTELQRGFMINYNLYRHYFPLMALGRARKFLSA